MLGQEVETAWREGEGRMERISLRPARLDGALKLTDLAMRSKARWGYDAAFMERCRDELTVTERHVRGALCLVADDSGRALGFVAAEISAQGDAEISLLFVAPEAMGRGIGRALIEAASTHFAGHGCAALVTAADPHAEAFYHGTGFATVGAEPSGSIPGRSLPIVRRELAP
jgi:GNAT superfamily N-acetyltransferase